MLIESQNLKDKIDRQLKYCHGYVGNKKEIYKDALLAVKSMIHELENKGSENIGFHK